MATQRRKPVSKKFLQQNCEMGDDDDGSCVHMNAIRLAAFHIRMKEQVMEKWHWERKSQRELAIAGYVSAVHYAYRRMRNKNSFLCSLIIHTHHRILVLSRFIFLHFFFTSRFALTAAAIAFYCIFYFII